ncbi:hypothetical protein FQR65_LT06526 [Abscondita terminalis]|nr:hypothetical protein FQR65_LT06526 [Abscondita terminalis]
MFTLLYFIVVYFCSIPNEPQKLTYLGSKTPYRFIENNNVTEPKFEGCVPTKVWMILRHGTRNPTAKLIKQMKEDLRMIRDEILLYSDLNRYQREALKTWQIRLNTNDANTLAEEGKLEMFLLARRMQKRFPSMFPLTYSNQTYSFKLTETERTMTSAFEFARGLFGHEESKNVYYNFYKYCKKWQVHVKNNPETLKEKQMFDNGFVMSSAVNDFNNNLKLRTPLNKELIGLIYTTCSFETAWNVRRSVWCYFLSLEFIKLLEFSSDLENYYMDGYGYEITYEQACPLFVDMINHFSSKDDAPTTALHFTHSGTILKFLAHLGLYKNDHPLKHTDYENNTNKWRQSYIGTFSSNLAMVKYTCRDGDKVAVFHQERVVKLPNCTELCSFDDIKKLYQKSIKCQFKEICKV